MSTVLHAAKRVADVGGVSVADQTPFRGYEIHSGRTERDPGTAPLLRFSDGELDGAVSSDGKIAGCYIHHLFDEPRQRAHWLTRVGAASDGIDHAAKVEAALDVVAKTLSDYLDIERIVEIAV